ncbi:MAG TPA: threonine synthase [Oscillospiraceae bacterium]|nr:threonine synthase [Oscillospiraceae bacterium]
MQYKSTRSNTEYVSASKAIISGISPGGGLYVPADIPEISLKDIMRLADKSYIDKAKAVLQLFLTDFTPEEIDYCVENAYQKGRFDSSYVVPVVNLSDNEYILELFKGPTCAFKDIALQLLPYLMTVSAEKKLTNKQIAILVATSGDTGKAALEGFKNVKGTKILVFYPEQGVSNMQKLQMATQEGDNVAVAAIKGNFDDAQTGVKKIFTDDEMLKRLKEKGYVFSSANSINWGRLVPQIVYYVSAYCDLLKNSKIKLGEKINIVVPTGNFGNILAAYYAKRMGIPVNKLICASNKNEVLTEFINTGVYNKNREFYTTASPSMDILISSNLERLIYHLSDEDSGLVSDLMEQLKTNGEYTVNGLIKSKLSELFSAGSCGEEETLLTIAECFNKYGYLPDTHTAVGLKVYNDYKKRTADNSVTIIAATASPYKFPSAVLSAITEENEVVDEFSMLSRLEEISKVEVPNQLTGLKDKPVRFNDSYGIDEMPEAVISMLDI